MVSTSVLRSSIKPQYRKPISSVWVSLRVCVGETNCRGTYSTGKTMRLTSKNLILNSLILEYCQFWEIHILILLVEEFPDRIVTYNLDFRGFWLSKGETTIFQKKQKIFLSLTSLKQKCHVGGTILIHLWLNAPLKQERW